MSSNNLAEEQSHHEEHHEELHEELPEEHHEERQEEEEEHLDETPEEELARIQKEIESLEDAGIELRLQLQSETVAQRKELEVVQEDENRLREHLAALETVDKKKLPDAEERVVKIEEQALHSVLAHLWEEEVALNNPDKMDLSDIKVEDLHGRAKTAEKTFSSILAKANSILEKQEKRINENTDAREKKKAEFKQKYDEEMSGISASRNLVKQVEREGHFHGHRGTNQRDRPFVSTQLKEDSRQRRINNAETRTNGELEARRSEVEEVEAQCVVLEKRLEEMKRIHETRQEELEKQLQQAEEDGIEAREMKEKFLEENQELMALKADINGVIHYVRAKNREYESV